MNGQLNQTTPSAWLKGRMAGAGVWVSVVVPVYNVRAYLERCVASIAGQSVEGMEILLVDDGSTDGSGAQCDAWAARDGRVRVLHQPNGGLSMARNAGIDAARGKYISFVDADDWIEPDMLEKLLFAAEACDAEIAECNYENVYAGRTEVEAVAGAGWLIADRSRALREELQWGRFKTVAWNKVYLRSLFADGLRYPAGKYHEDEFLTHRLFYRADRLVSIDDVLYHYDRTRADSIMGKPIAVRGADRIEALRAHSRFLKEHGEAELHRQLQGMYLGEAREYLRQCAEAGVRQPAVKKVRGWLREEQREQGQ